MKFPSKKFREHIYVIRGGLKQNRTVYVRSNFTNTLNVNARAAKVFLLAGDAAVNRAEGYIVERVPAAERAACRETVLALECCCERWKSELRMLLMIHRLKDSTLEKLMNKAISDVTGSLTPLPGEEAYRLPRRTRNLPIILVCSAPQWLVMTIILYPNVTGTNVQRWRTK